MCKDCDWQEEDHLDLFNARCDCGNDTWVRAYQDINAEMHLFRCTKCDHLQEKLVAAQSALKEQNRIG